MSSILSTNLMQCLAIVQYGNDVEFVEKIFVLTVYLQRDKWHKDYHLSKRLELLIYVAGPSYSKTIQWVREM